jgi:hypothetical protein
MAIEKIKTGLFCVHCGEATPHELTYISDKLVKTKCLKCGLALKFDEQELLLVYSEDFVKRIITKPGRVLEESFNDLSSFLKSLPIRIITKPKRIIKEIKDIMDN